MSNTKVVNIESAARNKTRKNVRKVTPKKPMIDDHTAKIKSLFAELQKAKDEYDKAQEIINNFSQKQSSIIGELVKLSGKKKFRLNDNMVYTAVYRKDTDKWHLKSPHSENADIFVFEE